VLPSFLRNVAAVAPALCFLRQVVLLKSIVDIIALGYVSIFMVGWLDLVLRRVLGYVYVYL
jgi:hypothetical protein